MLLGLSCPSYPHEDLVSPGQPGHAGVYSEAGGYNVSGLQAAQHLRLHYNVPSLEATQHLRPNCVLTSCALEGSRVWHGNLSGLPTDTLLQEVLAVFRMPCGSDTAQTGILRKEGGQSQCRLKWPLWTDSVRWIPREEVAASHSASPLLTPGSSLT